MVAFPPDARPHAVNGWEAIEARDGLVLLEPLAAGVVVGIFPAANHRVALRGLAALGTDRACQIVAGAGHGARPAEGS